MVGGPLGRGVQEALVEEGGPLEVSELAVALGDVEEKARQLLGPVGLGVALEGVLELAQVVVLLRGRELLARLDLRGVARPRHPGQRDGEAGADPERERAASY